MHTIANRNFGRIGPYLVVAPILIVILAFYGKQFLGAGILGPLVGALVGLLWTLVIGAIATWAMVRWRSSLLANAPVFAASVAIGLMTGGGLMYGWMMAAALHEPSTTSAVLSALMWPAVPFYITLNSAMELLFLSLLVFWNWDTDRRRRVLILGGVAAYSVMRVWTYLVFAETRLDIALHTLSPADVEWFKQTLATDFRIVLNVVTYLCLTLAAFVAPWHGHNSRPTVD